MKEVRWNLDDVLPVDQFDTLLNEISEGIKHCDDHFAKLAPDMSEEDYKALIAWDESLSLKFARLSSMPSLMEAADVKDETAKLLSEKSKDLGLIWEDKSRRIWHWFKGKEVAGKETLDDANAKRLFAIVPDIEYSMTRSREHAHYTLSEAEERIDSTKDVNGVSVLTDIRQVIEAEFTFEFAPEGKEPRTIDNAEELKVFVSSQDPHEREAAYRALLGKYKDNLDKFFMVYQAVVKDWVAMGKIRGYKSSIAQRNHANEVPDEAVDVLLDVCSKNCGLFQRFFKWKAQQLGMEKLRRFDIYAPLPHAKERTVAYEDAIPMVLDTMHKFHPGFAERAKQIIDANHIDSHPRPTKRGGGFCATVSPEIKPYILLNHTNKARDVPTVAHELGHGIHSIYAEHHCIDTQHPPLPLAETASTFCEMILFEKLLAEEEDPAQKTAMLAEKMGDSYATIIRQNFFVKFELAAHEALAKGITREELSELWLDTLKEQFGDSVDIDDLFRYEWAYIPHIVESPFYCYSYNFGELLSLALYNRYKTEGSDFISKIERILAAGGAEDPVKVLKDVGIDMCDPQFWQGSFTLLEEWMKQLESA